MTTPIYVLGADLSHYQQRPDMDKLWDAGVRYIIPKATERMAVDPDFEWIVEAATTKGMVIPACYAFVRGDDTVATVNNFMKVANGIPLALDDEATGVSQSVMDMWVKGYEDKAGRDGLGYYGLYPNAPISDLFGHWPRWFPQYPGSNSAPSRIPAWDGTVPMSDWRNTFLIWQFTGTSRIPGITTTQFDLNRLACPIEVLEAWAKGGSAAWTSQETFTPPTVPPVPDNGLQPGPLTLGARDLYLHSTGDDVKELQTLLAKVGASPMTIDGDFGPETLSAVKWFQRQSGTLTIDGWAGQETDAKLIAMAQ